jgi:hypothetical protein
LRQKTPVLAFESKKFGIVAFGIAARNGVCDVSLRITFAHKSQKRGILGQKRAIQDTRSGNGAESRSVSVALQTRIHLEIAYLGHVPATASLSMS